MRRTILLPTIAACSLLGAVMLSGCGSETISQPPPPCVPKFVYSKVANLGPGFDVIDEEVHTNAGSTPDTFTFTSTHESTVSVEESTITTLNNNAQVNTSGLEADPETEIAMPLAEQMAAYNTVFQTDSSVQLKSTLNAGSAVTTTIPPGATGYALYGVMVEVTRGTMQQTGCVAESQYGNKTILLPINYYSCSWSRGPDEFTAGGQVPAVCGKIVAYDSSQ